jgi:hypothetical protein
MDLIINCCYNGNGNDDANGTVDLFTLNIISSRSKAMK